MPSTLPVPSKGALRTLRTLALGTSCTVVFSAGLLTVDQQRRIHSAREVQHNAKKLKASKNYNGATDRQAEMFEEQFMRYRDESFWLVDEKTKETDASQDQLPNRRSVVHRRTSHAESHRARMESRIPQCSKTLVSYRPQGSYRTQEPVRKGPRRERIIDRQLRLALDVTTFLMDGKDPVAITAALRRFLEAFEESPDIGVGGIDAPLMTAAARLSKACKKISDISAREKILDIVLGYGEVSEEDFRRFDPEATIRACLKDALQDARNKSRAKESHLLPRNVPDRKLVGDPRRLEKAASFFLTSFKVTQDDAQRQSPSDSMRALGTELSSLTSHCGLFDLAGRLLRYMTEWQGADFEQAPKNIINLIVTYHGLGQYQAVLNQWEIFQDKFSSARSERSITLSRRDLEHLVTRLVESAVNERQFDLAENVLHSCTALGGAGFELSTSWLIKVLGGHWRYHSNIVETQALFIRLEPLIPLTKFPGQVFAAVIQYCVEAKQSSMARAHYSEYLKLGDSSDDESIVRIRGHFALANAMEEDWSAVEDDLRLLAEIRPGLIGPISIKSTPALPVKVDTRPAFVNEPRHAFRMESEPTENDQQPFTNRHPTEETLAQDQCANPATTVKLDSRAKVFTDIFVPILKLFIASHSLHETEEFVHKYVQSYRIPLSSYITNLMIKAYGAAGEVESILRLVNLTTSAATKIDSQGFNAMLDSVYKSAAFNFRDADILCRSVGKLDASFVDGETASIMSKIAVRTSSGPQAASRRIRHTSGIIDTAYNSDSRRAYGEMRMAMTEGNDQRALEIYKKALHDEISMHPNLISSAVRATLNLNADDSNKAVRLLDAARLKDFDCGEAIVTLLLHQVLQLGSNIQSQSKAFMTTVSDMVSAVEKNGIAVSVHIFTTITSQLVARGKFQDAISYWEAITQMRSIPETQLDIPILTVLLNAYIGLADANGVEWVMRVLQRNETVPDSRFRMYLKRARDAPNFRLRSAINLALERCAAMTVEHVKKKNEISAKLLAIMKTAVDVDVQTKTKTKRKKRTPASQAQDGGREEEDDWTKDFINGEGSARESKVYPEDESSYVPYTPPHAGAAMG